MASYDANTCGSELVRDYSPHIQGKTILITGASPGGLGGFCAETLAAAGPALLILAGRNPTKLQKTADAIGQSSAVATRLLIVDFESFRSVREAADVVKNVWTDVPVIDGLMNNAGIMACDYAACPEGNGNERQLTANHLGPFLFTNLVMSKILAAKAPRIVNVSSDGHRLSPFRFADYNFDGGETYNKWHAYGQSKTANMLMAISLAEKLGNRGLLAFSLHPGVIGTNLGNHLDWNADLASLRAADRALGNAEGWSEFRYKTLDQGIATTVYAVFEPSLSAHNGAYLENCHVADPRRETVKPWATSRVEADRLWSMSEELVGQRFEY